MPPPSPWLYTLLQALVIVLVHRCLGCVAIDRSWRQVNIVVASVDGHMADDQVRTSSKVARGTPKWRSS